MTDSPRLNGNGDEEAGFSWKLDVKFAADSFKNLKSAVFDYMNISLNSSSIESLEHSWIIHNQAGDPCRSIDAKASHPLIVDKIARLRAEADELEKLMKST